MRLKSLKLAGFKSFANPTTFSFKHDITAIVGPNGCGKSNVIDAIRWVLGETSAKQLRGGAMSDVIFAGTQDKAAKSMASVELTFEHTQDEQTGIRHELNLYHELSIRRQVNKDGRSDYFINGTRCRRRDVVDIFLGTGLGARSYSVIEQGMIGRIVDSSPMQLREFIEEAAGVSRYQARREETQKKLEKTEENLSRLIDLQSELEKQHKSLERQAKAAQTYQALKDELAVIEHKLAVQQLYTAKQAQQQHKHSHDQLQQRIQASEQHTAQQQVALDKLDERIAEQQWLKDDARDSLHQQQLAEQQLTQQLAQKTQQLSDLEAQLHDLTVQLTANTEQQHSLQNKTEDLEAKLAVHTPALATLQSQRDAQLAEQQPLQDAWQSLHSRRDALQDSERKLNQQRALTAHNLERLNKAEQKWQQKQQAWQQRHDQHHQNDNQAPNADQLTTINEQLKRLQRQHDDMQARLEDEEPQLRALRQTLHTQQTALTQLNTQHAKLSSEYDTLHKIAHRVAQPAQPPSVQPKATPSAASHSSTEQPTHPFSSALASPLLTLGDQIELTHAGQAHAQTLDMWLAMWLDAAIFPQNQTQTLNSAAPTSDTNTNDTNTNDLLNALATIAAPCSTKSASASKATSTTHSDTSAPNTLLLETSEDLTQTSTPNHSDHTSNHAIALSELIATPQLALWQQCYLYTGPLSNDSPASDSTSAPSAQNASALTDTLRRLPTGALLLTATGWLVSAMGMIHLSKLSGTANNDSHFLSQRLAQRARLSELETQLDTLEAQIEHDTQEHKHTQSQHDHASIQLEELSAQATALMSEQHRQRQKLTELTSKYEQAQAIKARLAEDKQQLDDEQAEQGSERTELAAQASAHQAELSNLTPQLQVIEEERQQLKQQRQHLNDQQQAATRAWQDLQLTVTELTSELKHTSTQRQSVQAAQAHLQQQKDAKHSQIQNLAPQLPELQARCKQMQADSHQQQIVHDEYAATLADMQARHSKQKTELINAQAAIAQEQTALAALAAQLAVANERINDASTRLDALHPKVSASSLLADFIANQRDRDIRPEKLDELSKEQTHIQEKIRKMGAVNMTAVAELDSINERLSPLTQQIDDIQHSMHTLQDAIATIDAKTKALFLQTLEAVNTDLSRLFAKVFGGGQASLTLNMDDISNNSIDNTDTNNNGSNPSAADNQWRAGLTLMAQPKGKRNSRLAVLSGGEKTLTALSLIFAIFKQHPAPFCVLDEVDAPLDDANVGRFTSLITELADEVQFIFISHNKLAMQIANELKGITMPVAGISKLVTVTLEEAEQYLEENAQEMH